MTRYFFHLRFGQRVMPDEEGMELPNRSAARDEASTVLRELADPQTGRPTRWWAGWFLHLADESGEFFRAPIGHPALELVNLDSCQLAEQGERRKEGARKVVGLAVPSMVNDVSFGGVAELREGRQFLWHRGAELLERSQSLGQDLSSILSTSEKLLARSREIVAHARLLRHAVG